MWFVSVTEKFWSLTESQKRVGISQVTEKSTYIDRVRTRVAESICSKSCSSAVTYFDIFSNPQIVFYTMTVPYRQSHIMFDTFLIKISHVMKQSPPSRLQLPCVSDTEAGCRRKCKRSKPPTTPSLNKFRPSSKPAKLYEQYIIYII